MTYRLFHTLVTAIVWLGLFLAAAQAASSSWYEMEGAKIRLLAQPTDDPAKIDAAIEVKLTKGWKTYWRNPGNSGIPLQLDFAASTNVKAARLFYPVPAILTDQYGTSVGYKDYVVFPIELVANDPNQKLEIVADVLIGICAEICIPVQVRLEIASAQFNASSFDESRALIAGRRALPAASLPTMAIVSAALDDGNSDNMIVEVTVPSSAKQIDLHVEGPANWYLVPGTLTKRNGGTAWFNVDIKDIPNGASAGSAELRFTLVADHVGIDQKLDMAQQ